MNQVFIDKIGKILEVFPNDMLVKSREMFNHCKHLAHAIIMLQKYQMKLNLSKCAFDINLWEFLGFLVTQRGIEVKSNQIQEILKMLSSSTMKEVLWLLGWLVA